MHIATIDDLIEHLETLRAALHPKSLSAEQYEALGWADRPLRNLIDHCHQEQERQSWQQQHAKEFSRLVLGKVTISGASVGLVNTGKIGTLTRAIGKEEP